jgi:hypothetical protein
MLVRLIAVVETPIGPITLGMVDDASAPVPGLLGLSDVLCSVSKCLSKNTCSSSAVIAGCRLSG